MGERMAYCGLPFPDDGCPVSGAYIYHVLDMSNVWDTVSALIHLPCMFPPMDILFWTTEWIMQNGTSLYQIYIQNLG